MILKIHPYHDLGDGDDDDPDDLDPGDGWGEHEQPGAGLASALKVSDEAQGSQGGIIYGDLKVG